MGLSLNNKTLVVVQICISIALFLIMYIAGRSQKTYPGFGYWTVSKIPHALGWFLIGLRNAIPDLLSVVLANALIFSAPILLYSGICKFKEQPHVDTFNLALGLILIALFFVFSHHSPNFNVRLLLLSIGLFIVLGRCAIQLLKGIPEPLQQSCRFTAGVFVIFEVVLVLRIITTANLPFFHSPFHADVWQSVFILATIIMPIGWTFGFFMMTNARLYNDLQSVQDELKTLATTDHLTGAMNRRAFMEQISLESIRANRSGRPLVILMIDIDYFKNFNDTYGHQAGDQLLREFVATCRTCLRATDLLVRWGGEEFVVVLPDSTHDCSRLIGEKLREAIEGVSIKVNTGVARSTISVGGTCWHPLHETWDEALQRADQALYQSKEQGRNRVVTTAAPGSFTNDFT